VCVKESEREEDVEEEEGEEEACVGWAKKGHSWLEERISVKDPRVIDGLLYDCEIVSVCVCVCV
jgi:hypothetical protein